MHGEYERLARELDDRREIPARIEAQLESMLRTRHTIARDQDRVSIGRTLGDGLHGGGAACSGPVVDDELLPKDMRQKLAHEARHDVGRAAGENRHDKAHRPGWISFRPSDAQNGVEREPARGQTKKSAARKFSVHPVAHGSCKPRLQLKHNGWSRYDRVSDARPL